MYVTMRTYEIESGTPVGLGRSAQEGFVRRLEQLPGFRQYHLIEGDDGKHVASWRSPALEPDHHGRIGLGEQHPGPGRGLGDRRVIQVATRPADKGCSCWSPGRSGSRASTR